MNHVVYHVLITESLMGHNDTMELFNQNLIFDMNEYGNLGNIRLDLYNEHILPRIQDDIENIPNLQNFLNSIQQGHVATIQLPEGEVLGYQITLNEVDPDNWSDEGFFAHGQQQYQPTAEEIQQQLVQELQNNPLDYAIWADQHLIDRLQLPYNSDNSPVSTNVSVFHEYIDSSPELAAQMGDIFANENFEDILDDLSDTDLDL